MSTNHRVFLSSFPLPSESVQSSCPYSLIMASHGLRRQGLRKPLRLFLFLAKIGTPRMDAFPPVFLWPQRVPQTLPGHMVTMGKRGHKTIYIPAESAGNVWKSIQIRAFNSFASERSRVRIPSGPPKINHPQGWLYFCCGPRDSRFMPWKGKSLQTYQAFRTIWKLDYSEFSFRLKKTATLVYAKSEALDYYISQVLLIYLNTIQ